MASKLSQDDNKFIDDLLNDKQSFFFKRSAKKKVNARRGSRRPLRSGCRFGFELSVHFGGFFIEYGSYRFGLGYTITDRSK